MNTKQTIALWVGIAALALALLFPFRYARTGEMIPRSIFVDGPPTYPYAKQFRDTEVFLIVVLTVGAVLTLGRRRTD